MAQCAPEDGGDFASWQHYFPAPESIKNIDFKQGKLPHQESIRLHIFK